MEETPERPDAPGSSIFIAEMDTLWLITGKQVKSTSPDLPWERIGHHVNEAPIVIHRNGRVFLAYSTSAMDANYCLCLLTADEGADLMDAASGKRSPEPVFRSSPETSQYGPGHNCFTTTPDEKTDLFVYHARNYEKIDGEPLHNPDRATRATRARRDLAPGVLVPKPSSEIRRTSKIHFVWIFRNLHTSVGPCPPPPKPIHGSMTS